VFYENIPHYFLTVKLKVKVWSAKNRADISLSQYCQGKVNVLGVTIRQGKVYKLLEPGLEAS
jgi:hypothetical protein